MTNPFSRHHIGVTAIKKSSAATLLALAGLLAVTAGAACADALSLNEATAITICRTTGLTHAQMADELRQFSWAERDIGDRQDAVVALAAAQASLLLGDGPASDLAAVHADRLATLTAWAKGNGDAITAATWLEGGSVTGRSHLLLETTAAGSRCVIALGRPASAADIAGVVAAPALPLQTATATALRFRAADGAVLLDAILPDAAAHAAAGINQTHVLLVTPRVASAPALSP